MLETPHHDEVTVEAETVEEALAEISAEFGADAEIMRAQKVHRGGVGGFFAREVVQLTARRRTDERVPFHPEPQPEAHDEPPAAGGGIADVLERMAQSADAEDSDFRTVLQRELSPKTESNDGPSFLAAIGWDEKTNQNDHEAPVVAAVATDVPEVIDDSLVPPFAEELPEPVMVGPALRPVPSPVENASNEQDSPADEPVLETQDYGPVIPLHDPAGGDFDDAAETEAPVPAAEIVETPATDAEVVELPVPEAGAVTDTPVDQAPSSAWRTDQPTDAPAGMGAVAWSTTALLRLGLPAPIISAVADIDTCDDLGWIDGIAAAVAPLCGPLPTHNVIVVGPHAERLAEPLGLPLVRAGDMAPYDGSFCAMVEDTSEDREWLEFVRGGRGIHLVVGDEPWQDLLIGEPVAVSWVGEGAVSSALYLSLTLGATLGYGTVDGFVSSMVRAQPTDVALAVRRIVGRQ